MLYSPSQLFVKKMHIDLSLRRVCLSSACDFVAAMSHLLHFCKDFAFLSRPAVRFYQNPDETTIKIAYSALDVVDVVLLVTISEVISNAHVWVSLVYRQLSGQGPDGRLGCWQH